MGKSPAAFLYPPIPLNGSTISSRTGRGPRRPVAQDEISVQVAQSIHEPARSNGAHSSGLFTAKHARPKLPTPYVAPRNDLERALEGVWQDTLGIQAPGVTDNFVSLGGHSLLAIQVATRIRDLFAIEFSVAKLYQSPTIAGLALMVAGEMKKRKTSAVNATGCQRREPFTIGPHS